MSLAPPSKRPEFSRFIRGFVVKKSRNGQDPPTVVASSGIGPLLWRPFIQHNPNSPTLDTKIQNRTFCCHLAGYLNFRYLRYHTDTMAVKDRPSPWHLMNEVVYLTRMFRSTNRHFTTHLHWLESVKTSSGIIPDSTWRWQIEENHNICGPVAQWITRLTTDQKIPGSTPGRLDVPNFYF